MKTLEDLKNGKAESGETYENNGNKVIFYGSTPSRFAHYKLIPTNLYGEAKTKKIAIKFLERGF